MELENKTVLSLKQYCIRCYVALSNVLYTGNRLQKKMFIDFVNLEHFLILTLFK